MKEWDNTYRPDSFSSRILEEQKDKLYVLGNTERGDLMVYDPRSGIFKPGERTIRLRANELLGRRVRTSYIEEILKLVHLQAPRKSAEKFDNDCNIITFANGVLKVKEDQFVPSSPKFMCRTRIPHNYDPQANCPLIDQFLNEVVSSEYHPLIEEILGCALMGDVRHEKCLLILGPGATGKSVFLKVVQAMVGLENTANVPLQDLVDKHFYRAELYGKRLNAFADINNVGPKALGILKALISGDQMMAERKYKDPFSFSNSAVLIFSCNQLPNFQQNDQALRRRLIVLPFPNQLEESTADVDLAKKLTTPEELPGLINRAIAGYRRLLQKGRFSIPEESHKILTRHFQGEESVQTFLSECTVEVAHARIAKTEFYSAYERYCHTRLGVDGTKSDSIQPISRNKFSKNLRRLCQSVRDGKTSTSDRRDAWIGITLLKEKSRAFSEEEGV